LHSDKIFQTLKNS